MQQGLPEIEEDLPQVEEVEPKIILTKDVNIDQLLLTNMLNQLIVNIKKMLVKK